MTSDGHDSMRDVFSRTLCELGAEVPNLAVLDADVSKSTRTAGFCQTCRERFVEVGVAEQNMVSIAAGLASAGMIPLVATFSVLLAMRALDQVRQSVCYPRLNVKLIGHYSGLSDSFDGPTHQSTEDLAIMRSLPNMVVIVPSDGAEVAPALRAAVAYEGPVFLRLCRNAMPRVYARPPEFKIGKGRQVRPGRHVTIAAIGIMVSPALEVADELEGEGISCGVIALPTLKPLDTELVAHAARETGAMVTVEEHSIYGGLGSAVAEAIVETSPVPMERVGIRDTFAESGDYLELLAKYGLGREDISAAVRRVVARKGGETQPGC